MAPGVDSERRVSLEGDLSDAELPDDRGMDRVVLLGISWRRGMPELRVRGGASEQSVLLPLRELELSYRATGPRVCLGHVPFRDSTRTYADCLRPPAEGGRRCDRCAAAEATFAASLHHAHTREPSMIDVSVRDHLMQTNLLYLAAFRDGSIKVGTTTETRTQQRLAEQGAWRATIVAVASDGIAVRQLEDVVTEVLGIAQSVSIGRKLEGLAVASPVEAAERDAQLRVVLASAAGKVHQILDAAPDSRLTPQDQGWIHPVHDDPLWSRVHRYPHRLDQGAHRLQLLDACGRAVALQRPGGSDVFVADIGQLFGLQLELGDYGSTEIVVQDALF